MGKKSKKLIKHFFLGVISLLLLIFAAQMFSANRFAPPGDNQANLLAAYNPPRPLAEMNLTPLVSGNEYGGSFTGIGGVNYSRVDNNTAEAQMFSVRLTGDTAQTAVSLVDESGRPQTTEMISLSGGYIVFRLQPQGTGYVAFRGARGGSYNYAFSRFRNFPFFEGE